MNDIARSQIKDLAALDLLGGIHRKALLELAPGVPPDHAHLADFRIPRDFAAEVNPRFGSTGRPVALPVIRNVPSHHLAKLHSASM